jgi:hypothetical protein
VVGRQTADDADAAAAAMARRRYIFHAFFRNVAHTEDASSDAIRGGAPARGSLEAPQAPAAPQLLPGGAGGAVSARPETQAPAAPWLLLGGSGRAAAADVETDAGTEAGGYDGDVVAQERRRQSLFEAARRMSRTSQAAPLLAPSMAESDKPQADSGRSVATTISVAALPSAPCAAPGPAQQQVVYPLLRVHVLAQSAQ